MSARIDLTNRWVVLGVLFLVGLTAPIQLQAVAALAPFMIARTGLTYTDVGVLTGIFMLPGVVLAAPCGLLAARFGERTMLALGLLLMAGSGIAFALTESYAVMVACRLLGGAGAVALTVLLPKVVTDWFIGKEIATALSIIAASVGLGIGLAMALLPALAAATSWQAAMVANSAFALLAVALLLVAWRDQAETPALAAGSVAMWRIDRPELVLSALAGVGRGLFSAGYAVFMSFLPALLIAQGMAPVEAGLLTSLAAVTSLISVPLGGYLSDRTGKPNYFIVGGSVTTALVCILIPFTAPIILWVLLFGALRGGCTGGIMALPSRVLRPDSRNTGFAVVSGMYFACMAAFPAIAGYLLDATGRADAPMLFAALLWLMISGLLALFLALQRRWIPAVR